MEFVRRFDFECFGSHRLCLGELTGAMRFSPGFVSCTQQNGNWGLTWTVKSSRQTGEPNDTNEKVHIGNAYPHVLFWRYSIRPASGASRRVFVRRTVAYSCLGHRRRVSTRKSLSIVPGLEFRYSDNIHSWSERFCGNWTKP